jgi:hypothetical protein
MFTVAVGSSLGRMMRAPWPLLSSANHIKIRVSFFVVLSSLLCSVMFDFWVFSHSLFIRPSVHPSIRPSLPCVLFAKQCKMFSFYFTISLFTTLSTFCSRPPLPFPSSSLILPLAFYSLLTIITATVSLRLSMLDYIRCKLVNIVEEGIVARQGPER